MTYVEKHEGAVKAALDNARPETADAYVARRITDLRQEFTRNGIELLDQDALASPDRKVREEYDKNLQTTLEAADKEREALEQACRAAIEASSELKSPAEEWGTGTEKFLLASILDEQQQQRVRTEIAATRASVDQIANVYKNSSDTRDSAFVRHVERAARTGTLEGLGVVFDGSVESVAAQMRLQELIAERRRARVPAWLFEAQTRLRATRTLTFTHTLDHLRRGRGIARRTAAA